MLAVIYRYKVFLIILALIILSALIWLLLSAQGSSRVPSKGVFVSSQTADSIGTEGGRSIVATGIYKG